MMAFCPEKVTFALSNEKMAHFVDPRVYIGLTAAIIGDEQKLPSLKSLSRTRENLYVTFTIATFC